jgi:hypothetical protein
MHRVRITGWRPGLRKISMTHALRTHAKLGLAAAKAVTDEVLGGAVVEVHLPSSEAAAALAAELEVLGAQAEIAPVEADRTAG